MSQPLLAVNGLMMRFGGLLAVNNVSLELREREIVSLIGPNGAGKTTVFNCLTGFYKPTGGTIMLRERHLEGLPGQQIARMGVVRTFQHVRLFREMTVIENLLVAQHQQLKTGLFSGLLKTPLSAARKVKRWTARRPGLSVLACWNMPTARPVIWLTATSAGWRLPAAW
ncbi:high-affinity branched-chain amino acid transport ATP-binding protein [Salmonella enterica subsp. enterica]|uniref:High-affinity branched-chain amino acid transport ATP-binding protein LivG n=1 Tax=Salmonella enterica I TaxID=59201 RepID=A0A379W169_SALET|nr:high-affinity branched-chain amino acid transport ATP-binding protein [Salmonella enterica subsp. enterica]